MEIIYLLIPLSLILVAAALWAFFWAVKSGQFDDLESPGLDILDDEVSASGREDAHKTPPAPQEPPTS